MMPKVYILLPVHNRKEITRGFIECLLAQRYTAFHLVLIDDGSSDGTEQMVRERIPDATVLRGTGTWWWAGSLQQGLNWLKKNSPMPSDIVLMINDDVAFGAEFLENGVRFLMDFPRALLLARFYDGEEGKVVETGVSADFRRMHFPVAQSQEEINCLSTRGLFLRWDACLRIGGFHPLILPHYGSDNEFTIRAGRKGFALRTSPEVYLLPDLKATGLHVHEGLDLKTLFSKRCSVNPIYWTVFIMLAFPVRWIPRNLVKLWLRTSWIFWKARRANT